MNNKQALSYIEQTDQLLNSFGSAIMLENKHERRRALNRVLSGAKDIQRNCYDPYWFGIRNEDDTISYTCLICGKVIGGTSLNHVINLTEDGLVGDDRTLEDAVLKLKELLLVEPALSEQEIREALRDYIVELVKTR